MTRRSLGRLVLALAPVKLVLALLRATLADGPVPGSPTLWLLPMTLLVVWIEIAALVRRTHDIGWRLGRLVALLVLLLVAARLGTPVALLAAIYGMVLLAVLLLDGTAGPNRFGADPRGRVAAPDASVWQRLRRHLDAGTAVGLAACMAGVMLIAVGAPWLGSRLPTGLTYRLGAVALAERVPGRWRCPAPAATTALAQLAARLDPTTSVTILFTSHPHVDGLAVPGRTIAIGQDVARLASDPDALAGLVVHEIAHVRRRDAATA